MKVPLLDLKAQHDPIQNEIEDAIRQGISRATKTLRQVQSAWVKEQRLEVRDNAISAYQVNLLVTFVLEDTD